jgi:ATP-dependent exoDNAse (exonuclease V) beta subunit
MLLSLQNPHIRDGNIRFQEEGHKYTILTDLTSKYTSTTTWIHSHFSKFDADAVVASMMKGKNWTPANKYWGLTPKQIKQQWSDSGISAANAGTKMHYEIECFMNQQGTHMGTHRVGTHRVGTHHDLLNRYNKEAQTTLEWDFFLEFIRNTPELVPYRTEWLIYDEQVKISGSIDMVYENQDDGTLMIYDWKRSSKIEKTNGWNKSATTECIAHLPDSNFWHYALQLNTYKTILERNYGKRVSAMFLVRLHPDNPKKTYDLIKVPVLETEMSDLFEGILNK